MPLKPINSSPGGLNRFLEFGFLLGKRALRSWCTASLAAGIGFAVGNRETFVMESYDSETFDPAAAFPDQDFAAVSLPLEAQLFFAPVSQIGFGLSLLGNINTHESVWGVLLGVQLRG
jgi:hypothetical protein